MNTFNVRDFPFDKQSLVIEVEDATNLRDQILYEPDIESSGFIKNMALQGWKYKEMSITENPTVFDTTFGDPRTKLKDSVYSRIDYRLYIDRPVIGLFTKTILPIIIVILITFASFLIKPGYLDARLCLTITALLTAVALQFTSSSTLPEVGYIVSIDQIYILSYLIILATTIISVISSRLYDEEKQKLAVKIDKIGFYLLFCIFFIGLISLIAINKL